MPEEARGLNLNCDQCKATFDENQDLLEHREICGVAEAATNLTAVVPTQSAVKEEIQEIEDTEEETIEDPEEEIVQPIVEPQVVVNLFEPEVEMVEGGEKALRHSEDAANNNSSEGDENENDDEMESEPLSVEAAAAAAAAAAFVPGHVTLEALQNTKVAVAQFAANAIANSPDSETAIKELAMLQTTLFTLQHQQVFQLQLIQQLQSQLSMNQPDKENDEDMDSDCEDGIDEMQEDEELKEENDNFNENNIEKNNHISEQFNPKMEPEALIKR